MSPIKSICILAIALCGLAGVGYAQDANDPLMGMTQILNKLESYVLENKETSGLTIDELINTARQYESWNPEYKEVLIKAPSFRLVRDFVLEPMKFLRFQVTGNKPELIDRHLRRVEAAYKRFRPSYFGENIEGGAMKMKIPASLKLHNILLDIDPEPLTVEHFMRAKRENDVWRARLEELVTTEDVFAYLDEVRSIKNYLNKPVFQPVYNHIYPSLTKNSNPAELKALYHLKLWEDQSIRIENQTPIVYRKPVTELPDVNVEPVANA